MRISSVVVAINAIVAGTLLPCTTFATEDGAVGFTFTEASCDNYLSVEDVSVECGDDNVCSGGETVLLQGTATLTADAPSDTYLEVKICAFDFWGVQAGCKKLVKKSDEVGICDIPGLTLTSNSFTCPEAGTYSLEISQELSSDVWDKIPSSGFMSGYSVTAVATFSDYSKCRAKFAYTTYNASTMTWSFAGMAALAAAAVWRRKQRTMASQPLISASEHDGSDFVEMSDRTSAVV